jgi:exonuclease SbcC
MFTRLFKPKWEHADPGSRCQAIEAGGVPPDALARMAREDQEPAVRLSAVERLSDLELLAALTGTEPLTEIRAAASRRQREVLAAPLSAGPPLAARLEAIARAASAQLCSYLAREAEAPEIRAAALERVQETAVLCAIAVDDALASLRRAALERIDDPQGWERVAREARNKDKQICRMARERLDAYRKRQAEQEAAERLCAELETVAGTAPDAGSRQRLMRLTTQWEQLEMRPGSPLKQRFADARQQLAEAIARYQRVLGERQTLCAGLEALLEGVKGDGVSVPEATERLQQAEAQWARLTPALADDDVLSTRFAALLEQLQGALKRLVDDQARSAPLRSLMEQAADLLAADPDRLDERGISELERRWDALEHPASAGMAEALQQEFVSRCALLRERLKRQETRRRQALEEAGRLIAGMPDLLREGELERALSQRDRARHLLKIAAGSDEGKRAALQARLRGLHPRFEQLRQWRRWGSGNARERLCDEIEVLVDSALPADEIATRVRTAREEWKRIDRAEGPAGEELWLRFDHACTRAYEPYRQARRQHAERLAAHLAQKQALRDELDAFERSTDWKTVDWRAADRMVRKAKERWRRIGPVPAGTRKSLEKHYRDVLARLESHLERERERELRRRRALIRRVEQLATIADRRSAIHEVKELQKQWSPTVQANPEVEQALWAAFRRACDAVFSQAKEERAVADMERRANLDRKSALCEELEAVLDNKGADFHALAQRLAAARAEWESIGSVPRKLEHSVERRYGVLINRFAERREQEAKTASQVLLKGLRERNVLCERLESAALGSSLGEVERDRLVADTRRAWEGLAPLDVPRARGLERRFERVSQALAGDSAARKELLDELPRNLTRRLELCLQMEIAAGVDSPAEFGEARLRLKVSRLADALGHRQEEVHNAAEQLRELLLDWYQTGPAPLEARDGLHARIARILAAAG